MQQPVIEPLKVIYTVLIMASNFCLEKCVINNDDTAEVLKPLTDKGIATVISFCEIQKRPDLDKYLNSSPSVVLSHASCRRKFTDSRILKKIKLDEEACSSETVVRQLCSSTSSVSWKTMCFLCGIETD